MLGDTAIGVSRFVDYRVGRSYRDGRNQPAPTWRLSAAVTSVYAETAQTQSALWLELFEHGHPSSHATALVGLHTLLRYS